MIFKRLLMPMLIVGIVFTTGSMVYAQTITCGVGAGASGASTNATSTGHTEPVGAGPIEIPGDIAVGSTGTTAPRIAGGGAIRVTCTNTGAVGTTTTPGVIVLTVSLGVPITNNSSFPAGAGVRLGNFVGDFAATNVGISSLTNSAGTIVLGLGTPVATTTASPNTGILFTAGSTATPTTSSFDILGVLVSTNGLKNPCKRGFDRVDSERYDRHNRDYNSSIGARTTSHQERPSRIG